MNRIARAALLGALALAVGAAAYGAEPAQTKSDSPPKKGAARRPASAAVKAPGDTVRMWPHRAEEGRKFIRASGEVIDMFCYLDRGFTGEIHRECAEICLKGGMPMGLLTRNGDVYLLTMHHDYAMDKELVTYAKAYQDLLKWAARQVQVGGFLIQRKGIKAIEVIEAKRLDEFVPIVGADTTATQVP